MRDFCRVSTMPGVLLIVPFIQFFFKLDLDGESHNRPHIFGACIQLFSNFMADMPFCSESHPRRLRHIVVRASSSLTKIMCIEMCFCSKTPYAWIAWCEVESLGLKTAVDKHDSTWSGHGKNTTEQTWPEAKRVTTDLWIQVGCTSKQLTPFLCVCVCVLPFSQYRTTAHYVFRSQSKCWNWNPKSCRCWQMLVPWVKLQQSKPIKCQQLFPGGLSRRRFIAGKINELNGWRSIAWLPEG